MIIMLIQTLTLQFLSPLILMGGQGSAEMDQPKILLFPNPILFYLFVSHLLWLLTEHESLLHSFQMSLCLQS